MSIFVNGRIYFQVNSRILNFVVSDIDECIETKTECDANAICTNTPGSYNCACISGFSGDGGQCIGI